MAPPSRQVRRCGGRLRPSGERVVGTSARRRLAREDLTTISLANSMPVVRRSRSEDRVPAEARMPQ